jgi:hypothetical protein
MADGNESSGTGTSAASTATADTSATNTNATSTETAVPAQTAEAIRKYKVKVDGADMEVDEKELLSGYSKSKAADKRFQDAMQMRKQSETFINLLKTDPIKVLSDPAIGHDMRKLAEDYLIEQVKNEMMSPEQRELKDIKSKLLKYEDEKKAFEQQQDLERHQQLESQYTQNYQAEIIQALDQAGLPKTARTAGRFAHYLEQALLRGQQALKEGNEVEAKQWFGMKASDMIDFVRKDYKEDTVSMYGQLPPEQLLQMLGPDIAKKIREADLAAYKTNNMPGQRQASAPQESAAINHELKAEKKDSYQKTLKKKGYIDRDTWKQKMEDIKNGND